MNLGEVGGGYSFADTVRSVQESPGNSELVAKLMSYPMNLGAEPYGKDTGDRRNPIAGGGAVMRSPFTRRLLAREHLGTGSVANRHRS